MYSGEPLRIFVSHAWQEHDDYLRVFEYLEDARGFRYVNCSVTERPATATSVAAVEEALRRQIAASEIVIGLATLIAGHQDLLRFELSCARGLRKPVIFLPAFGHDLVLPTAYKGYAAAEITWNERELVDALLLHARGVKPDRWDVVEFKLD